MSFNKYLVIILFLFTLSINLIAEEGSKKQNKITETTIIDDPLDGSTSGQTVGGSFNSDGYRPGIGNNHILYDVPIQIPNGYVEFEVKGFSHESVPADENHAFVILYDGRGISEPIGYYDDFKHNYFRWNVHWRQNRSVFKAVIACADPTPERINSNLAVYEDKNGDGLDSHDRDWYTEPNGSGQSWNPNSWYTIKVQWNNKKFEVFVEGVKKWSVTGPNDYNPVDFKIWLGSGPDKYDSDVNVTYRNFKLVSFDTGGSDYLIASPESSNLPSESGDFLVNISSNINWSVSEDLDWVEVNPANGSGNGAITVNYDENPTSMERSGDININGDGLSETVSIVQEGSDITEYIVITPEADSVNAVSGSISFIITSNVDWTISDTSDWASPSILSGSGNDSITISYDENPYTFDRVTGFLVESIAGNEEFVLTQLGFTVPGFLTVTPTKDTVGNESGSGTLQLESNLSWTITDDVSWLSKSPSSGAGDTTIVFNYAENEEIYPRSATITITADTIIENINIEQLGKPLNILVTTNPAEGGSVSENGSYHLGDSVQITAIPNEGWGFLNYVESDTILTYDSLYSFVVIKPRQIIANFELLSDVNGHNSKLPNEFTLENNYPNPFNPSTNIGFSLPTDTYVSIVLYDILGKKVKLLISEMRKRGSYTINLDASDLPSGIYYYQMRAGTFSDTKRLLLLK